MNVIINASLEETFSNLIAGSIEQKDFNFSPAVENYLITVISDLSSSAYKLVPHSIYINDFVKQGMASSGESRAIYLRTAGDAALFVSGIFPDALNSRKIYFTLGDFIEIGQRAYSAIQNEIYDELAYRFPEMVDVLNNVGLEVKMISGNLNNYVVRRRTIDAYLSRR